MNNASRLLLGLPAKMVVKEEAEVPDTSQQDENPINECLQIIQNSSNFQSSSELIQSCRHIISCLARIDGESQNTFSVMEKVEEHLVCVLTAVSHDIRREIVSAILENMHEKTTQTYLKTCPILSIMLVVIGHDWEESRATARRMVQQEEAGGDMRNSLNCLFAWLIQLDDTFAPCLAHWLLLLINALEEKEHFALLTETSLEQLGNMISLLGDSSSVTESSVDVILHVLASLRESLPAFNAIASHAVRVLNNLASESGQFSRQLLQDLIDIITVMINVLFPNGSGDKQQVINLRNCLKDHMASSCCKYLKQPPWPMVAGPQIPVRGPSELVAHGKVGLVNLGNTCYMNSVVQALLHSSQFSAHVMTKMEGIPYWTNTAILFAKLTHSLCVRVDPIDFFVVAKPPYFNTQMQHDSSEFLGYLFQLLKSYEDYTDFQFEYSKPTVLPKIPKPSVRTRSLQAMAGQTSSRFDNGSGPSTGSKRSLPENKAVPLKKRLRLYEAPQIREPSPGSFVDVMFGGALRTSSKCTVCHAMSISRDMFLDLQLAFPDLPQKISHSVQSLLNFYCSTELLVGENKYYCGNCQSLRVAERSVLIEKAPKYLILVLKNFRFDPKRKEQTKLMLQMTYTQTVMLPTVTAQTKYSMYAAVIHCGDKLDSGHYYTLAKEPEGWYEFNDEKVKAVNELHINKLERCCTPYLLFYKRADMEEIPAPALKDLPAKLQECVMAHNKPYVGTVHANTHICPRMRVNKDIN